MQKIKKNQRNKLFEKYIKMSVPAKAGLWFTISGFLQRGIAFLTTPIFTRLLSTEQYGVVSVFNTWVELITILCTLNLFSGGFNNGMRDYKEKRDSYVSVIQGLITVISLFWFAVYCIGRPYWNNLLEMDTPIVVLMFLQIVTFAALSLWAGRERFEFKYKTLIAVTVVNTFAGAVLPIIAILIFPREQGAIVRIVAHSLSIICICGAVYIYNIIKGKVLFNKEIWKSAFLFNLPLLPHYLSTMILNHSDRIMIGKMVGASEAALYSVAYSAAMILNILVTAINNSFAPWIYGAIDKRKFSDIKRVGDALFVGMSLALMILIAFAPECIYVFAGSKYTSVVKIVPSVTASLYFIFMYQIFANVEFYFKQNKFIAYASILGAALNVVLNYFGIKMFGYIAPGYTTLFCYIVFGIAHYMFMKRICEKELDSAILFDSKTIFLTAIGLVLFSIIMVFLYSYTLVRYAILSTIMIIIFFNKNKITKYIRILSKKES